MMYDETRQLEFFATHAGTVVGPPSGFDRLEMVRCDKRADVRMLEQVPRRSQ
jgi:hypothetical protein